MEDGSKYYRFTCPLGCRVLDVLNKLAKVENTSLDKIKVNITEEQTGQLVESLGP